MTLTPMFWYMVVVILALGAYGTWLTRKPSETGGLFLSFLLRATVALVLSKDTESRLPLWVTAKESEQIEEQASMAGL